MEFSLLLGNKITVMLIWAAFGYAVVRLGAMKSEECRTLSNLLVYIITPCVIIHAFQIELTRERAAGLLAAILFSAAAEGLFILLTVILRKPMKLSTIDQGTLIFTNCGNLILPLVEMTLGSEYTFYVAAYISVFHIILWTYGMILFSGKDQVSLKKVLLNPNLISVAVGLFLMFARIRLPELADSSLAGISSMTGPVSMLVIGMVIADNDILGAFRFPKAYPIIFLRLLVYPVLLMAVLYLTGVLKAYPFLVPVLQVSMLSAAAPPATMVSQLAVVYDIEPFKASSYNIVGTILCLFSMPFVIYLYQMMF